MTDKPQLNLSPTDLLAMMCQEARRIVASGDQVAMGGQFPDPVAIAQVIGRMADINTHLLKIAEEYAKAADAAKDKAA